MLRFGWWTRGNEGTQTRISNQSEVLTKPHAGKGEATFHHYHRGQQTLLHEVMQAWDGVNES